MIGQTTGAGGQHRHSTTSQNFVNDLLLSNQPSAVEQIKQYTQSYRNFNLGAIAVFFLSTAFALVFFGWMKTAQVIFYFIFIAFAAANVAFYTVSPLTRVNLIKTRMYTVYLSFLVQLIFHLVNFVIFFSVLDDMNNKTNNAYPVPLEDTQQESSYVALTFILYVMPSLFQGLSFCAYVRELGIYHDYEGLKD